LHQYKNDKLFDFFYIFFHKIAMADTLSKQRLESYIQDEILEWQIFNTDYVDTYKLACTVIAIINDKPEIRPYELGYRTLSLLLDFYPCEKVFDFEEKEYCDFGKALLNARQWALEPEDGDDGDVNVKTLNQEDDDEENASELRTISLIGKSEKDLKHFTKEDLCSMWKFLALGKQKFTKSALISGILATKAPKVTFNCKFHRDLNLREMEVADLLYVLSYDQLIAVAEVVLCKQDYLGKSTEEIARKIKAQNSSHIGI